MLAAPLALIVALATAPTRAQDSFNAALSQLPGELRDVRTAGYWRTPEGGGTYRVIVMRGGYDHLADLLYIQWLKDPVVPGPATIVATIGVGEINDQGPYTFSHTLRAEATNRLRITVTARHTHSQKNQQFVFTATTPRMYTAARPSAPAPGKAP